MLQELKDLLKRFPKHPQLLSVGFLKSNWQLLKVEVFWENIQILAQIIENNEKFSKNEGKYFFVQFDVLNTKYEHLFQKDQLNEFLNAISKNSTLAATCYPELGPWLIQ